MDRDVVELQEDDSIIDKEVSESCEFTSTIYECIVELESVLAVKEALEGSQKSVSTPQSASCSESAGTLSTRQPPRTPTYAKLPKLELKKFSGNAIEWYPFWESFESAVHKNANLYEVDKFNYLKSLLVGTAQNVVAGLALTSENYEKAVELLKRRFENRQIVI